MPTNFAQSTCAGLASVLNCGTIAGDDDHVMGLEIADGAVACVFVGLVEGAAYSWRWEGSALRSRRQYLADPGSSATTPLSEWSWFLSYLVDSQVWIMALR